MSRLIDKTYRGAAVILLGLLAACNQTGGTIPTSTGSFASQNSGFDICSGYGCKIKDRGRFSQEQFEKLSDIMAAGQTSPAAERKAIAQAISTMETMSRQKLRYSRDIAFSYQRNAGRRGQMDCVDESLNTTQYLTFLHRTGLLKHHVPVKSYAERGFLLDGRYPHKSARMRQKGGKQWAVDSWKGDDGALPEVMPLSVWYKQDNNASNY